MSNRFQQKALPVAFLIVLTTILFLLVPETATANLIKDVNGFLLNTIMTPIYSTGAILDVIIYVLLSKDVRLCLTPFRRLGL